jgi:hypothetical protein
MGKKNKKIIEIYYILIMIPAIIVILWGFYLAYLEWKLWKLNYNINK